MMRAPALALVATLLAVAAAVGDQTPQDAKPHHRFDGQWSTILSCVNAQGALGYSFEFLSVVKDDLLHGEKGTKGQAGWLQLDGRILADGTASLYASGLVGAAPYAVGERPAGSAYGYHIDAHFTATAGNGKRVEGRPCTVEFSRKQ